MNRAAIILGYLAAILAAILGNLVCLVLALGAILAGVTSEALRGKGIGCLQCGRNMPTRRRLCALCRSAFPLGGSWQW